MKKRSVKTKILVIIIAAIFIGTAFTIIYSVPVGNHGREIKSFAISSSHNMSITGNVAENFQGYQIGVNNEPSPWGANDVIKGLYLTYNSTDLFIGVDENISGNSLMVFLTNVTEAVY